MSKKSLLGVSLVFLSSLAVGFLSASALAAGPGTATMTVTAVGKKEAPPELKREDIQLYQGKQRTQVSGWRHGEKLFLAVLIDDSLESSIANQWDDLRAFLSAQSAETYVAVGYAQNGTVRVAQDFTNDHALAGKALRLPMGGAQAFASPYLSLLDWIKRWPANAAGERGSILLLSSGLDPFRGFGIANPDVDSAIERAQKTNINVWTIYAPSSGHFGRGFFRLNNAQNHLSEIAEETGGESYYLGTGAPVNLKPYFDEISDHLSHQYLLSFVGDGGKKGKLVRARVGTEVQNVEFLAAPLAFLPATPQ